MAKPLKKNNVGGAMGGAGASGSFGAQTAIEEGTMAGIGAGLQPATGLAAGAISGAMKTPTGAGLGAAGMGGVGAQPSSATQKAPTVGAEPKTGEGLAYAATVGKLEQRPTGAGMTKAAGSGAIGGDKQIEQTPPETGLIKGAATGATKAITPATPVEIVDMVAGMSSKAPGLLTDPNLFKQAVGYDTLTADQKAAIDAAYAGNQNLLDKQNKATELSTMTGSDLAMMRLSNEEQTLLQQTNPEKFSEYVSAKNEITTINNSNSAISGESKPYEIVEKLPQDEIRDMGFETNKYNESDSLALYDEMVNTEEVNNMNKELGDLNTQIAQLEEEKFNLLDSLQERYPNLPQSALNALYRDEVEGIDKSLRTLMIDRNGLQATIDSIKEENMTRFGIVMEDKKMAEERMWKNMERDFKITQQQFQNDMQTKTYNLGVEKWDYAKKMDQQELALALHASVNSSNFDGFLTEKQKVEAKFGGPVGVYADPETGSMIYYDPENPYNILGTYDGGSMAQEAQRWNNQTTNEGSLMVGTDWDVDVNMYDPIAAPVGGTIEAIYENTPGRTDGNIQMRIRTADGGLLTMNHLDPSTIDRYGSLVGKQINAGDIIAVGGNTGNVMDINGNKIRWNGVVHDQAKLDQGLGSHLDIHYVGADGRSRTGGEVRDYVKKNSLGIKYDQPSEVPSGFLESLPIMDDFTSVAIDAYTDKKLPMMLETVQNALGRGDIATARKRFETAFEDNLSSAESQTIRARRQMIFDMQKLDKMMDDYISKGGNLGRLEGSQEEVANRFGKTKDADMAALSTKALDMLDLLARDRTGAAMTPAEEAFYTRLLPGPKKSPEYNKAQVSQRLDTLENNTSGMLEREIKGMVSDDTYNLLYYGKAPSISQTTNPLFDGGFFQVNPYQSYASTYSTSSLDSLFSEYLD